MLFELLWVDIIPHYRIFGFGILSFENDKKGGQRNLFAIYYNHGEWFIDLFYKRLIGD